MDDPRKLIRIAMGEIDDFVTNEDRGVRRQAELVQGIATELISHICELYGHKMVAGPRKKNKVKLLCHYCQADLTHA